MSRLEDFVEQNRYGFEEEMPHGHLDRFEAKLSPVKTMNIRLVWAARLAIAASIVAFFVLFTQNIQQQLPQTAETLPVEYLEVEQFYQASINKKLGQLKAKQCANDVFTEEKLLNDLKEIDQNYRQLRNELLRSGNKEQVIEAMINCFRVKENFIDQVLNQINKNC